MATREELKAGKRCYVVTWDIASDGTRAALVERLKAFGWFCPIHRNCWAVVTDLKAVDVRAALVPLLGSSDRLFVIRSGVEAAWRNSFGPKHDEWLKKFL